MKQTVLELAAERRLKLSQHQCKYRWTNPWGPTLRQKKVRKLLTVERRRLRLSHSPKHEHPYWLFNANWSGLNLYAHHPKQDWVGCLYVCLCVLGVLYMCMYTHICTHTWVCICNDYNKKEAINMRERKHGMVWREGSTRGWKEWKEENASLLLHLKIFLKNRKITLKYPHIVDLGQMLSTRLCIFLKVIKYRFRFLC